MRSLPELESSRPWGVSRSASYVHGLKDQVLDLGLECSVLGHGSCDCISGRWVWKLVTAVPHAVIRQISQTLENLSESKMPRVHGKMNSVTWTVSLSHGLEAETGTAMSLRVMIQVDSFHFVNAFVAVVWSQWTASLSARQVPWPVRNRKKLMEQQDTCCLPPKNGKTRDRWTQMVL